MYSDDDDPYGEEVELLSGGVLLSLSSLKKNPEFYSQGNQGLEIEIFDSRQ